MTKHLDFLLTVIPHFQGVCLYHFKCTELTLLPDCVSMAELLEIIRPFIWVKNP